MMEGVSVKDKSGLMVQVKDSLVERKESGVDRIQAVQIRIGNCVTVAVCSTMLTRSPAAVSCFNRIT